MLSPKIENYIEDILSYINYPKAKKAVRMEIYDHLSQKMEFYKNSSNVEEAEILALRDMGNASEVGKELNKLHKPFLGWIYKNLKIFAITSALIIFSLALLNIGANYARNQRIDKNTSTYISNMYWEINAATHSLSYIDSWNNSVNSSDHSVNPFSQLLFRLNTMKNYSQIAPQYIGPTEGVDRLSSVASSFELVYQSIGGGVSYNNQLLCYDFLKDDILSESEIKFLITLREDLMSIQDRLVNNETKEFNYDISLVEFAEIINPFINKYSVSNLTGLGLSN